MKTFIKSIRFTLVFCIFLAVSYILVLWIFARVAGPNKGNVAVSQLNGKVVGATNVGQSFTKDIYFWGRPSCAGNGYDATKSSGSNKAPTNSAYLKEVDKRITVFLKHHPYLKRKDVPAEMVTASGSGLDPDISPESAYIQVRRIAMARGCSEKIIKTVVDKSIEKPLLGFLGTERVNVLKLNISLDELTVNKADMKKAAY
jgi:potassium-transporting ATPase KdpC subunit